MLQQTHNTPQQSLREIRTKQHQVQGAGKHKDYLSTGQIANNAYWHSSAPGPQGTHGPNMSVIPLPATFAATACVGIQLWCLDRVGTYHLDCQREPSGLTCAGCALHGHGC